MAAGAWAYFGGRLATDLTDVVDLATDAEALDAGGWWAVCAQFDGPALAYRFASVRETDLPAAAPWTGPAPDAWRSSLGPAEYRERIHQVRRYVEAGDVYQVNVCRMLAAPLPRTAQPAALARVLAHGNPAPYAGVLDTGDDWVVCASPELFLCRNGADVESAPIKGTTAEGGDYAEKDVAENVMITDLVRNDLNRICEPDSVAVRALLADEPHPGLRHLVSRVGGTLRAGVGWREVLAATFPPGSVSGAPKIRALDVIGELEPVPRRVYCGAVGWVDADRGRAELAVAIRTFFTDRGPDGGRRLNFGTGAGITHPSDPDAEWRETELKARRLIALASPGETAR